MRVAVNKITKSGIKLDCQVPAESWNLNGFDVKFINKIKVKGILKKDYSQIVSKIDIFSYRQISCSRCLVEVCRIKKYDFSKNYQLVNLGNFLDIGKDIREEILLDFPLQVLCFSGCRGLCSGCGVNLNWRKCNCQSGR